jgi:3-oxoacyl-[acyl-carrier protein] reductase
MDLQIQNRKALVCGASQGLGLAIAEALAAEGARVGLLARNGAKLKEAAQRIGGNAQAITADMANWPSLDVALSTFGLPSILVLNSGGPPLSKASEPDAAIWQAQFEAMVINQQKLVRAVLPAMRQSGFGRILSVASTSVVEPIDGLSISGALRAALASWLKSLSTEVAADGVTVNVLLTGSFKTGRIDKINANAAQSRGIAVAEVERESAARLPTKRYGDPKEFAAVAAFLASPRASYVTGAMIRIDGGSTHAL